MEEKAFTIDGITEWLAQKAKTDEDMYYVGAIAGTYLCYERLRSENAEQKEEIERLASVNMQTIGENADLLLQVAELTEERDDMHNDVIRAEEYAEMLKKQVDELEAENNRYAELFGMVGKDFYTVEVDEWEKVKTGVKDMIQQAVKDTAKEILQKIMNIIKKSDGFLAEEVIRIMAKLNGVEVE
jgi:hypothetical protein